MNYEPVQSADIRNAAYEVAELLRKSKRPFETALVIEGTARLPNNYLNEAVCIYLNLANSEDDREKMQAPSKFANRLGYHLRDPDVPLVALPKPPAGGHLYFKGVLNKNYEDLSSSERGMLWDIVNKAPFPWYAYLSYLHRRDLSQNVRPLDAAKNVVSIWGWYNAYVIPALRARPLEFKAARTMPAGFAKVMDGVHPCR